MGQGKLRKLNGNIATKWIHNIAFLGNTIHRKVKKKKKQSYILPNQTLDLNSYP